MLRIFLLAALSLVASPALVGAASADGCRFSYASADDGCADAPRGEVVRPDLMTTARQSGQTYFAPHPQPWNLAGVDYPVGHRTPVSKLADPKTDTPAGCVWHDTGYPWNPGAPYISCKGANPSIKRLNFSAVGGHACVGIVLSDVTGRATIEDNYFNADAACGNNRIKYGGLVIGWIYLPFGSTNDLDLVSNTFVGNAKDNSCCGETPSGYSVMAANTRGVVTMRYNAFLQIPGHVYGAGMAADSSKIVVEYNLFDGFHYRAPQGHGEIASQNLLFLNKESFNTIVINADQCACLMTAIYVASAPSTNDSVRIDHNTIIVNRIGGASGIVTRPVTAHLADGVLTVDANPSGGPIVAGQSVSGTALVTYRNVSGSGVGSQWTTDCMVAAASSQCPGSSGWTGVYNNTATTGPFTTMFTANAANSAIDLGHGTYTGTIEVTDNFIDATGAAFGAFRSRGAKCLAGRARFSGNVNLLNGGRIDAWAPNAAGAGC